MKLTRKKLRQMIQESMHSPQYSVSEIVMDIVRRGGPDHFLSIAHDIPGMKCTDFMHYEHALGGYIQSVSEYDPERAEWLQQMPNNIWRQICNLLKEIV